LIASFLSDADKMKTSLKDKLKSKFQTDIGSDDTESEESIDVTKVAAV